MTNIETTHLTENAVDFYKVANNSVNKSKPPDCESLYFVELAENTEHGDGNQTILHLKDSESWRNDPKKKNQYKNRDRPEHWQKRLEDLEKNG